ncbi:MAG: hypothetical protein ACK5DG_06860 [Chitinophagaceae bacterium]|jgi:fumarate reductase subunit C
MKNPKNIRVFSFLLIVALFAPIGSLVYELFSIKDDSGLSLVLMMLIFSFFNYLFTIRFCNRLLNTNFTPVKKGQYIMYLIMSIVSFLFSFFFLSIFSYDFIENQANSNQSFLSFTDTGIVDSLNIIGLTVYAVLGLFMFFMQLSVRKQLIQSQEKIEDLINAIGIETEN